MKHRFILSDARAMHEALLARSLAAGGSSFNTTALRTDGHDNRLQRGDHSKEWDREIRTDVANVLAWLDDRGIKHHRIGESFMHTFKLDDREAVEFKVRWL